MGHSHAVSGGLAWLAAAPAIQAATDTQLSISQLAAGTIVCSGAALLPDLDHPQATIAQFLGPVSQLLARAVAAVAGGHRQATHSVAFCVLSAAGVWALLQAFDDRGGLAVLFVCTALALRGLGLAPPGRGPIVGGVTIGVQAAAVTWAFTRYAPGGWEWLPAAVALGCLTHLIGDCATPGGCPLAWPLPVRVSLPIIARTGNAVEVALLTPLMTVALAWLSYTQIIAPALHDVGRPLTGAVAPAVDEGSGGLTAAG